MAIIRFFSQFSRNLETLVENIADILIMDIGRRNTRKYSFRCPDLMELRKFYDAVYRCFTFTEYQLLPTMEEYAYLLGILVYDIVTFIGVEGILESRVIAEVIHLRKFDIHANLTVRGNIRGLTSKFLLENDFSSNNANSVVEFKTILSLLVYGLVLNPDPTLLGDTYFSIHHMTSKEGGTIVYFAPLLYKWFISRFPESSIFQENKDCLRWSQRLMYLANDDITWYSSIYDDVEITDSYEEFSNVPFLRTQGGITYNPALARRKLGKGKGEPGLRNCVALEPYTSWMKKRAKEFKMPDAYKRPMSLVMVKSPNIKGIEELQEALDRMKQERDDLESKFHTSNLEKVELQK
ncbi:uncharacterized protein LOC127095749 [Lathyrus oleraceus]|uniref:uncharacterized protein LOC127095749 n=1 Tax=Pisum sativum TaxID=3888 RepID=UPI0021CF280D|nr:uncharacterized protein LOC127095749 [Pisum sativum]